MTTRKVLYWPQPMKKISYLDWPLTPKTGQEMTPVKFVIMFTDKLNKVIERVNEISSVIDNYLEEKAIEFEKKRDE
jgi:hypothetical protein